jgi:hypothetical protein
MREHRVKPAYALARGLEVLRVLHERRAASLHELLLATGIPKRGACSCYSSVTPAMKSKAGSMRFVARIIPRRAQWDNEPHSALNRSTRSSGASRSLPMPAGAIAARGLTGDTGKRRLQCVR